MGFNFPDAPTPGQVYGSYTWDAATGAWKLTASGGSGPGGSITISDTPPASPVAGALWWESDTGNLYIYYNDGNSSQWVLAVPAMSASSIGAVAYTAQTLTREPPPAGVVEPLPYSGALMTQRTQARQNIYAAPFDAMAYSGLQINGGMEVNQLTTTTVPSGYVIDNWVGSRGGSSTLTFGLYPGFGTAALGLTSFLAMLVTTAQTTLTGTDYAEFVQVIEGTRVSRLAWGTASAQPITIGFWTCHYRTGTYSVAVRSVATPIRSYVTTYTHNAPGVWQYNVVTIPGDTGGTWPTNNTAALLVDFVIACGPTYTTPTPGVWAVGNYFAAPGQVNGIAATSDVFRFTGVVVLPGIEAPSAARASLILRPYDQELRACQRYYETGVEPGFYLGAAMVGSTVGYWTVPFLVSKRAAPQISFAGTWQYFSGGSGANFTPTARNSNLGWFSFAGNGLTNWQGWIESGNGSAYWVADTRI